MSPHQTHTLLAGIDWRENARLAHYRASKLAERCAVSRPALERFSQAFLGKPPQLWLDYERQIEIERRLRGGRQLKEIAFEVGYRQPSHMTRQFKETHHGISPSEWRAAVLSSAPTSMLIFLRIHLKAARPNRNEFTSLRDVRTDFLTNSESCCENESRAQRKDNSPKRKPRDSQRNLAENQTTCTYENDQNHSSHITMVSQAGRTCAEFCSHSERSRLHAF